MANLEDEAKDIFDKLNNKAHELKGRAEQKYKDSQENNTDPTNE